MQSSHKNKDKAITITFKDITNIVVADDMDYDRHMCHISNRQRSHIRNGHCSHRINGHCSHRIKWTL